MSREVVLTSFDNPYDPFDEFSQWLSWDTQARHGSLEILDRLSVASSTLSDAIQNDDVEDAIDYMVANDIFPTKYIKVVRENGKTTYYNGHDPGRDTPG